MRQHHTKVHEIRLPNRTCAGCGCTFYDPKAQRTFCDDCNPNAGEHNGNWKGGKDTATCQKCGSEFAYFSSEKKGRYCSECVKESDTFLGDPYRKDAESMEIDCRYCGVSMVVLKSDARRRRGRYCSQDCLAEWLSENVVGEAHHQWKGGSIDYGQGWWSIRRQALERDEHTCQRCGKSRSELGKEPDVHHIQPVRTFDDPQNAHSLENVVCLCRSCHREVEEKTSTMAE